MILMIVILSSCSGYQSFTDWTQREKLIEVGYLVTSYIDHQQTKHVSERGRELNPQLGEHPSNAEITRYFLVTRLLHFVIADYLDHNDRLTWLGLTLGASGTTIYWNYRQGF